MTQFIDDRNEKLAGELKKLVYSDEIPVKNYRMHAQEVHGKR